MSLNPRRTRAGVSRAVRPFLPGPAKVGGQRPGEPPATSGPHPPRWLRSSRTTARPAAPPGPWRGARPSAGPQCPRRRGVHRRAPARPSGGSASGGPGPTPGLRPFRSWRCRWPLSWRIRAASRAWRSETPARAWAGARPSGRRGGRLRQAHHPVAADPADQFDGRIPQHPGQAGDVVAGVHDDRDVRVSGLPLADRDEPLHHGPQLAEAGRFREPRRTSSGGRLAITGFVSVTCTLVGAHDQTEVARMSGESPREQNPFETPFEIVAPSTA